MNNIKAKFEQFFEFEKDINLLLDDEKYELFEQQQALFSDQLKDFLKQYSTEELNDEIKQLKRLENLINLLQERATVETAKLKEQSLSMQRNKKKMNAYK